MAPRPLGGTLPGGRRAVADAPAAAVGVGVRRPALRGAGAPQPQGHRQDTDVCRDKQLH